MKNLTKYLRQANKQSVFKKRHRQKTNKKNIKKYLNK